MKLSKGFAMRSFLLHFGFLPLDLMLGGLAGVSVGWTAWLIVTCGYLCSLILYGQKGRLRVPLCIGMNLAFMVMSFWLLPIQQAFYLLVIPVLSCISSFHLLRHDIADGTTPDVFQRLSTILALVCFIACQLMITQSDHAPALTAFGALTWPIHLAFVLYMIVLLVAINQNSVSDAGHGREKAPSSVRNRNYLLTGLLAGVVFVIALIPQITRFLQSLWALVRDAVIAAVRWLLSHFQQRTVTDTGSAPAEGMDFGSIETAEPTLFQQFLEKVMMVIGLALCAALVVFLLYHLGKKLKKWFARIQKYLAVYFASSSEDYIDEVSDTRMDNLDSDETRRQRHRKRKNWSERGLTSVQKIRLRYQIMEEKHPEWPAYTTARNHLPPALASTYEKARYSQEEVSESEMQQFQL